MEPTDHLAALRCESAALVAVAHGDLAAPVPTCPGWTVGDLVVHTGVIHQRLARSVQTRSTGPIRAEPHMATDPRRPDLAGWFEEVAAALVATLVEAGPEAEVWHWFPGGTARVVIRRAAHETTVHRWDGENALGDADPIASDLAADGVDEVITALLPHVIWSGGPPEGARPTGETVHLHRTDGPGEWLLRFTPAGLEATREHAAGDVAVRGGASDLLLFLWGRASAERLEVPGDETLLDRWAELAPVI